MTGEIGVQEIAAAANYLESYRTNGKLLFMDNYEREYFEEKEGILHDILDEVPIARERMSEMRQFISSLDNCDEKLFLYYYYVKGRSVETCGDLLGVSRSTAYRLKKRAIRMVAEVLLAKRRSEAD